MLYTIKNAKKKTVCRIDPDKRIVEIVSKGCKTVIKFNNDKTVYVTNS